MAYPLDVQPAPIQAPPFREAGAHVYVEYDEQELAQLADDQYISGGVDEILEFQGFVGDCPTFTYCARPRVLPPTCADLKITGVGTHQYVPIPINEPSKYLVRFDWPDIMSFFWFEPPKDAILFADFEPPDTPPECSVTDAFVECPPEEVQVCITRPMAILTPGMTVALPPEFDSSFSNAFNVLGV